MKAKKFLYLMGGSGCGKTTLAKRLEEFDPETYHRVLEITTREKREEETDMWDYEFVTPEEFHNILETGNLFETVEFQFLPAQYGARYTQIDNEKWNVVVASIEGFLSALNNVGDGNIHYLVNIVNDDVLDVERKNRNPKDEENINLAMLYNLCQSFYTAKGEVVHFGYCEIKLSELKKFRNDKTKCLEYFKDILFEE